MLCKSYFGFQIKRIPRSKQPTTVSVQQSKLLFAGGYKKLVVEIACKFGRVWLTLYSVCLSQLFRQRDGKGELSGQTLINVPESGQPVICCLFL